MEHLEGRVCPFPDIVTWKMRATHVWEKSHYPEKNPLKNQVPSCKNPKPVSQIQKFPAAGLIKMVLWESHPKMGWKSLHCRLFGTGWETLNLVSYALCRHQIKEAVAGLRDVLWCFLQIWILISCSYFQGAKEYYILTNTSFQAETDSLWHSKTCQEKHLGGNKVQSLWFILCCLPSSPLKPENPKLLFKNFTNCISIENEFPKG